MARPTAAHERSWLPTPPRGCQERKAWKRLPFEPGAVRASHVLRSMVRKGSPVRVRQRALALARRLRVSVAVHLEERVHSASNPAPVPKYGRVAGTKAGREA